MLLKDGREVRVCFTGLGGSLPIGVPPIQPTPGVCVSRLPGVAGIDHIPEGHYPEGYDVWFVNLFAHQHTVTHIKERFPEAKVIVQVDTLPESLHHTDARNLIRQLMAADMQAATSEVIGGFYEGLTGKGYVVIPAPIGPTQWFEERRDKTRAAEFAKTGELKPDDFILAVDHFYNGDWCLPNIAALMAVQRATGLDVKYINASDATRAYAREVGLKGVFLPKMEFDVVLEETSKAVLAVDMYAAHSQGRHEVAMAAMGLPTIGSNYTGFETPWSYDPFDARSVAGFAHGRALFYKNFYRQIRDIGKQLWLRRSDESIKKTVEEAVNELMKLDKPISVGA
jgi:hypothetical protein